MKKLWVRIFLQIAAIFAVFVIVLTVSNRIFLVGFYESSEKRLLREQGEYISSLNFEDGTLVVDTLSSISDSYNFEVEIFNDRGMVLYTSYGSQMLEFYYKDNPGLSMNHKFLRPTESETLSNGSVFERATDEYTETEYLIYRTALGGGINAELRVQTALLHNSAEVAEQFTAIIAIICLLLSLLWVIFSARRISRPISEMSEITRDMANLKFDRKVMDTTNDEIGMLGRSVNELSENLSATLLDLQDKNNKLRDEIELERQLDSMRRGFIANVSHELKTPISIIEGYAEGLKMNINPESRDSYCDTIIDESKRMNRLVLSLLELSRYESGQIPLNKENFSISTLAREMCERIFRNTPVSVCVCEEEILCHADRAQIEQVFKSILENAKSHTPENGEIKIAFSLNDGAVRTEIYNTGSQIDSDKMPQIWQSFYRGDQSHKREENRFGLGLSIVSAICKMHGRSCGVFNTENGVCFWFETDLPQDDTLKEDI